MGPLATKESILNNFQLESVIPLADFERAYTDWVLRLNGFNKRKTARTLGIALNTLSRYATAKPDRKTLALKRQRAALKKYGDEDFAQWLAERTLKGIGEKQLLIHARVEYLRHIGGDSRTKSHESRRRLDLAGSADMTHAEAITETTLAAFWYDNPWIERLTERQRVVTFLLWAGFAKQEIALVLGVSPAVVWQQIIRIKACIQTKRK